MHRDAIAQANRIRALYADSAATRAQLDAAETGLARAKAGLAQPRGARRLSSARSARTPSSALRSRGS